MSGGALNYFYYQLEEHSHDFDDDRELNDLVQDLAELFHAREWCLSGDTGEGEWREAKQKFKRKWFTAYGRRERIEQYFDQIKAEFSDMVGINDDKVCQNCKHWTAESERYGKCDIHDYDLNHRSDTCEKWEARDAKN